jgi:hypothetical protein
MNASEHDPSDVPLGDDSIPPKAPPESGLASGYFPIEIAIIDFYGERAVTGPRRFQVEHFRAALREDLLRDRAVATELPAGAPAGLRTPLLLLVLSLAFAAAVVFLTIDSFKLWEQKLWLEPSELFSTEGLLIDTLRKRADLDISQRDKLIGEYQTRSQMREAYAKALLAASAADRQLSEESGGAAIGPAAYAVGAAANVAGAAAAAAIAPAASADPAPARAQATLQGLARSTSIDPLVSDKLSKTLDAVASGLRRSEPGAAAEALADLQASLKSSAGAGSASARSALGVASALSSSLAQLKAPRPVADSGDSVIAAMHAVQQERLALLDRIEVLQFEKARLDGEAEALAGRFKDLQAETARLKREADASAGRLKAEALAAYPSAGFLGTVSVISGKRVFLDLASAFDAKVGALVVLFRPGAGGRGKLLAIAKIAGIRGATAELELQSLFDQDAPLRLRDTAYVGR